jgi:hypothetical protein
MDAAGQAPVQRERPRGGARRAQAIRRSVLPCAVRWCYRDHAGAQASYACDPRQEHKRTERSCAELRSKTPRRRSARSELGRYQQRAAARSQTGRDDRNVAEALARCALPERRKESSGGTVADASLWAIALVRHRRRGAGCGRLLRRQRTRQFGSARRTEAITPMSRSSVRLTPLSGRLGALWR